MNNKILSTLFIISSLSCSDEEPIKNLYQEEVINHLLKAKEVYTRKIKHLDEKQLVEGEDPFVSGSIQGYQWFQKGITQQYESCKENNNFYEQLPLYLLTEEQQLHALYQLKGNDDPGIFAKKGLSLGAEQALFCWLITNQKDIPSSSEYDSLDTLFKKNPLIFLARRCQENKINELLAEQVYENHYQQYHGFSNKTFKVYAPILFNKEQINKSFSEIINFVTLDPKRLNTFIYNNGLFSSELESFNHHASIIDTMWGSDEKFKTTKKFILPLCLSFCKAIDDSGCFVNHKPYIGKLMTVNKDNIPQDALEQTPDVKIGYLKEMFKPSYSGTFALTEFNGKTKKKVFNFLCSVKAFKKNHVSLGIIPKPVINLILQKLAIYQQAENMRFLLRWDIEKTKIVSQATKNLDELTMTDDIRLFLADLKTEKVINFIINDFLPWFDKEALR